MLELENGLAGLAATGFGAGFGLLYADDEEEASTLVVVAVVPVEIRGTTVLGRLFVDACG